MKKYDSYKDSGVEWIEEIPVHWNPNKLKYLNDITKETISTEDVKQQKVIHYSIPNVQKFGTGILEDGEDIDSSKLLLSGGEILISKLNPRKSTVCIVGNHNELIVGSGEFISFKPNSVNDKFLFYNFINQRFTEYLDSSVESVTRSHQRVNPDLVYDTLLFVPPLQEQHQIVKYLDTKTTKIDTLIEKTQRKIELLKEQRTSLINHVVTKGLNPNVEMKDSGVEWIGEIPIHWEFVKVGHYTYVVRGGSPRPSGDPRFFNGNYIHWITVKDITSKNGKYVTSTETMLTKEGMKQSRVLEPETLVLTNSGVTLGIPGILKIKGCINDGSVGFLNISPKVERDYLYYFWTTLTKLLLEQQSGYGQPNLNIEIVSKIKFPFPPKTEQTQIVEYLDEQTQIIDTTIEKEQKRIELLKEYRQSLISEVVTGKIKVTTHEQEVFRTTV